MDMGACRSSGYIAIGLVVFAVAPERVALAQGGRALTRPVAAVAGVPPVASRLEPAHAILGTLVGTWRFEIWFAGNFAGAPDASGTRVVTTLFDDLRLQWTEQLDHSAIQARGLLGFDPGSGRFFSSTVSSAGPTPEFMTGTLDDAEPLLTFRPLADSTAVSFAMTMLDDNHFRVAALDHSWRAVFTRQPAAQ
jgi:uncharacterized protein DUF1579